MDFEKSPEEFLGGFTFEDKVHAALGALATRHGDLAEHVGRTSGETGALTGDEVVSLNPADTAGREVRVVFESKNRKLGLRKVLDELDRAIANRGAAAGVAVFAGWEKAPTAVPFHYYGNRAVVVFDSDIADDRTLELAYMWARWEARKLVSESTDAVDMVRVGSAIDDAKRALARAATVRRYHSTAKRSIESAGTELSGLIDDVETALTLLVAELEV